MIRSTVATLCIALAALGTAAAEPKVALTVDGDEKGRVRDAVAEALESDELKLVSEKSTYRAVSRAGDVTELSEKQIKKLEKELRADAIIYALLDDGGRGKVLRFKLYVNGKRVKGFSMLFARADSAREVANKLRAKKYKEGLHDKVLSKLAGRFDRDEDEDEDEEAEEEDEDGERRKVARKRKDRDSDDERADEDEGDEEEAEDEDEDEEEEDGDRGDEKRTAALDDEEGLDEEGSLTKRGSRSSARPAANRAAIRLDIGGSVSARRLAFTVRSDLDDAARPAPFRPGPVPGLRLELELYPLAFLNRDGAASGLGVGVAYDKVVSSKVQAVDGPEMGTVATVNQQLYTVSARYRVAFGKSATSPTVTIGAGYGRRTFKVNNAFMDRGNLDLPDTDYKYIAPLLAFRIPFARSFALVAAGEAMLVRDTGRIQDADQYGRAKVFGIDAMAGFDIVFGDRFALRVTGELTQIGFSFVGNGGELANSRDGDPTSLDVGGALDRSFGGAATFAVLY